MDKLNMSLDQIIKLQKKEKKQMQNKVAQAQKGKGGQKKAGQRKRTNVAGKGFKQFRGRVGGKKVGAPAGNKGVSPLNRKGRGQNQQKQLPRKGLKNQQIKARKAVKQAQIKLQQKYTQQNRRNQRSQAFNQRRGLAQQKAQNTGIKQRLGFRKGQGQGQSQQQRRRLLNRNVGGGSKMRMDIVSRQQARNQRQQTRNQQKQFSPRRINRQQGSNLQRQITNQPAKKRRWGKTQQNISTNPILQVSVPNKPTKSVSIQLSPNRQQNPQQRRLSNKVFQVQVAQDRQQKKQMKQQQQPQQSRQINNILAQSQRQQQQLENQVNHLQAVIANIQKTSTVKQNVNINRGEFAKRSTGLSLNQRFSSTAAPQPAITQIIPQTTFGSARGRGGRGGRGRRNRGRGQQQIQRGRGGGGAQRMVFL